MENFRVETDDAIYIRSKSISIADPKKSYKYENLLEAVKKVKTNKLKVSTAALKFKVPKQAIVAYLKRESKKKDSLQVYSNETIKKYANTIIFKNYARFQTEFSPKSKFFNKNIRISVTGADKLDGIENFRATLRSNFSDIPNTPIPGGPNKYLPFEEDEEKFIKLILERLKMQKPMTTVEMRETARTIAEGRTPGAGIPSRAWTSHMKHKYKPIFYGDQIQIKLEVLDEDEMDESFQWEHNNAVEPESIDNLTKRTSKKSGEKNSVIVSRTQQSSTIRKFNFCRFCMSSRSKLSELRDIPEDFLKIFEHFFGGELEQFDELSNKICVTCNIQCTNFVSFLQKITDTQSKIKDFVTRRDVKVELGDCEAFINDYDVMGHLRNESSMMNSDRVLVKLETPDENVQYQDAEYLDEHEDTLTENCSHVNIEKVLCGQSTIFTKSLEKEIDSDVLTDSKRNPPLEVTSSIKFSCDEYLKQFDKKSFVCDLCGFTGKRLKAVELHIERIHLKKKFTNQCPICGLFFECLSRFSRHKLNAHQKNEPKCDICGKILKNNEALRRHKHIYHVEKIACPLCGQLIAPRYMRDHQRKKHKPISCTYCEKEFPSQAYLQRHLQYVHEKTIETCLICQSTFQNKLKLKLHMERQHPTELYHCPALNCNYTSARKPYVKLHLSHHRDIDEDEKEKLWQKLRQTKPIPIST